ncbi:MAG: Lrp/AsnC family transcriptional regulator [Nanoarchaeota archaeon]|nr:Lrp/AsnC family transcriptional regulator [Nanoarchaeota archaeon]
MEDIDNKDKHLLLLLQKNSREQLKILARQIGLSIDSTKKRIEKLKQKGIIAKFGAFIDPKAVGYDLVANVQIKLHNISEEELAKFTSYLKAHNNVTTLITTLGDFDITCVLIAKNTGEMDSLFREIRQKFKNLIADWKSVINLNVYKFEEYNL